MARCRRYRRARRGRVPAGGLMRGDRFAGPRGAACGARRHEVIGDQAGECREHDQERNAPVRPAAFPEPEGGGWFGHAGSSTGLRRAVAGVVLRDQRLAVRANGTSDGADVPARIEVCAAGGEVVPFDPPDDRLPDPGSLADLRNGQTSLAPCGCQDLSDAHAAPPLPDRAAASVRRDGSYEYHSPPIPQRERSPSAGIWLPCGENRRGLPARPLSGVRDRESTTWVAAAERARQPRAVPPA